MLRAGVDSCRLFKTSRLTLRGPFHKPSAVLLLGPASRAVPFGAPLPTAESATSLFPRSRKLHTRAIHLSPISSRLGHRHTHTLPPAYKKRQIVINTCSQLYKRWRAERRHGYKHAPEAGTEISVGYMHTGMDRIEHKDSSERPLAVILPGAPGSYHDFRYTIPFLDGHGVDVLCVQWPDFKFTLETGYWWHSSEEKTCLLVDLLKQLNVKRIDMLVSHSTASYPAMQLATEVPEVEVDSMALLMPSSGNNISAMRHPIYLNPMTHWLLKVPSAYPVMSSCYKVVLMIARHPLKSHIDDAFLSYHAALGVDNDRYYGQLTSVLHRRLPMMVMISDTDKIISVEDYQEFILRLGCNPKKTWLYGEDGGLVRTGETGVVKVIELRKGSHYGFNRLPNICNEALLELLARVPPYPQRFHR